MQSLIDKACAVYFTSLEERSQVELRLQFRRLSARGDRGRLSRHQCFVQSGCGHFLKFDVLFLFVRAASAWSLDPSKLIDGSQIRVWQVVLYHVHRQHNRPKDTSLNAEELGDAPGSGSRCFGTAAAPPFCAGGLLDAVHSLVEKFLLTRASALLILFL